MFVVFNLLILVGLIITVLRREGMSTDDAINDADPVHILQLLAAVMVVVGALGFVELAKNKVLQEADEASIKAVHVTLMAVGGFMFLVSFLGCCGGWKEIRVMLFIASIICTLIRVCGVDQSSKLIKTFDHITKTCYNELSSNSEESCRLDIYTDRELCFRKYMFHYMLRAIALETRIKSTGLIILTKYKPPFINCCVVLTMCFSTSSW